MSGAKWSLSWYFRTSRLKAEVYPTCLQKRIGTEGVVYQMTSSLELLFQKPLKVLVLGRFQSKECLEQELLQPESRCLQKKQEDGQIVLHRDAGSVDRFQLQRGYSCEL